jgi:hypothetical protein
MNRGPISDHFFNQLPLLRLPPSSAGDTSATAEDVEFEATIDERLSELARATECTPDQCVALALFLGSRGWTAFDVDMSDVSADPQRSSGKFRQAMMLDGVIYDERGGLAHKKQKLAAFAFVKLQRAWGLDPVSEESARTYVGKHRKRGVGERGKELLAIYNQNEAMLPYDDVLRLRRERLRSALVASAMRLARA